jgi:hypothetical protein
LHMGKAAPFLEERLTISQGKPGHITEEIWLLFHWGVAYPSTVVHSGWMVRETITPPSKNKDVPFPRIGCPPP